MDIQDETHCIWHTICYETAPLAIETLRHILQDPDIPHLAKLPAVKLTLDLERYHRKEISQKSADSPDITKADREKSRTQLEQEYQLLQESLKKLSPKRTALSSRG